SLALLFIAHTSLRQCWPSAARVLARQDEKRCSELARPGGVRRLGRKRGSLHCVSKKVVIVDAPKGTTSSSTEENFGFWIDEATKIVTLADGKKLSVRRFDDRWISAVRGDVSYELDRQNGLRKIYGDVLRGGFEISCQA